jgi:hypothetical protein
MTNTMRFGVLGLAATGLAGCTQPRPVVMAPPVAPPQPAMAAPVSNGEVYNWRDVPAGQQVPITRAVFDQGGYQLYAASGETIAVPFENQNMYVMKFGRTSGQMYFINENNTTPTLYVREGAFLENAAAQGAKWYPFPQNYAYTQPVYLGVAPSWSAYTGMGWYPGMTYYGGYYSTSPWVSGMAFGAMVGMMANIGGRPYYGWNSYSTYYRSNPTNRVLINNSRSNFNYSSVGRRSPSAGSFSRSSGGTGSFGGRSATGTRPGGSGFSASRPSFGSGSKTTGSFGGGSSANRPSFGGGSSAARPSFGSGSSGSRPSFGGGSSASRPSFGSGSSGFSSSRPSGGSSFGGGRSSGGSFGGGRSSFGGGRRR